MVSLDPYAVLGVSRTASRDEIARAYRAAVKRAHPDTGARTSPAQMARLTEAWRILGDPARRARHDRERASAVGGTRSFREPPPWTAPVIRPQSVRPVRPDIPRSRLDSGWVTAGVVLAISGVVGTLLVLVLLFAGPPVRSIAYAGEDLRFSYPDTWTLTSGEGSAAHRIIAHLTSFSTGDDERCVTFGLRCRWEGETLPSGGASIQIIAWEGGRPPEPAPSDTLLIGGAPAAFGQTTVGGEMLSAWWQLSPPGFPDRWIEVHAEVRGGEFERGRRLAQIEEMLESVEFR